MVEVKDLCLSLSSREILHHLNLKINDGEITVLLGANGSGKTSFVRCLSSYYSRYTGQILYGGRELSAYSGKEKCHLHSLMPQFLPSVRMTALELMEFSFRDEPFRKLGKEEKLKAEKLLSDAGLSSFRDRYVNELSGGERQLLFLCFMKAHDAMLYMLDEPDSNLDAVYTRRALNMMQEMRNEGKAVLSIFHDLNRAFSMADRFLVLDKGSLIFDGSRDEFVSERIHERVFNMQLLELYDKAGNVRRIFQ